MLAGVAVLAVTGVARAQIPEAEAAFATGHYRAARAAYERVLQTDSLNVRALYRLAVLDSWDGKLTRSLARFARLRRLEPRDGDIMVAHARVLAWAGRTRRAEILYDSVLAAAPGRADALAGRARAVAWAGDLESAERLWRAALAAHPDDPEILVGLAQSLFWRGQVDLAETYVARARQLAPGDRAARDLLGLLRAAVRPTFETAADYTSDSDRNAALGHRASFTQSVGGWRIGLRGGWRDAKDPARDGWSWGAAGHVVAPLGGGTVARAGVGARRLAPGIGPGRTVPTGEVGIGLRPSRFASFSVAYNRAPFDETALLIDSGYTMDAVDAAFDLTTAGGLSVSLGSGAGWLSDGNRRVGGVAAIMQRVGAGLELGGLARSLGWREPNPGRGYFAPNRFTIVEARGVYTWRRGRWGGRLDAGAGIQQVGAGTDQQGEWHAGLSVSRGWGAASEIALMGTWTNSAASSATGAYRFWSVGMRLRQTL
jgi:Flp pilus assembly protein TadD